MWLYFAAKNPSHSEGTWLCDNAFQPKTYPILRGPGYVIVSLGMKSNPFWGEKTVWLYFPAKHLSHSEGTWLCEYTSSQKPIPLWGDLTVWLYPKEWNLTHSEGTWLCDYTFQPKTYPTLRGPNYVIIVSSQKSFPIRGNLIMWLCPKQWNLLHPEGTWLCDYTFQLKIYPILRGPDYVMIFSSPKCILFWGDLAMWLYP